LGQTVKSLINEVQSAGIYSINWDGTNHRGKLVVSGIYFYRLRAGDFAMTKEMILLK